MYLKISKIISPKIQKSNKKENYQQKQAPTPTTSLRSNIFYTPCLKKMAQKMKQFPKEPQLSGDRANQGFENNQTESRMIGGGSGGLCGWSELLSERECSPTSDIMYNQEDEERAFEELFMDDLDMSNPSPITEFTQIEQPQQRQEERIT